MHIGDEAKATGHLSPLEYGLYARLRDKYMETEAPIPCSLAQRWAGARSADELAALSQVLEELFDLDGSSYRRALFDTALGHYEQKRTKAKRSAEARWSHHPEDANAMRTHAERMPSAPGLHLASGADALRSDIKRNASHKPIANNQKKDTHRVAVVVCVDPAIKALREGGLPDASAENPHVKALVKLGVEPNQFAGAARIAVSAGKGVAYAIGVIRQQLRDAEATASLPPKAATEWDSGRSSIERKGVELGLGKWDQEAWPAKGGESFSDYTERVRKALAQREGTAR